MKADMTLGLRDVPGSLLRALEPISSHGGNILSVLHSRGGKGLVEVKIVFQVADQSSLNLIKKKLEEQRVHISAIKLEGRMYYQKKNLSFLIVGHVIDQDIQDTIDRINSLALVSNMDIIMPNPEQRSSVIMNVEVDNERLKKLHGIMDKICREKDFLLIRSLE